MKTFDPVAFRAFRNADAKATAARREADALRAEAVRLEIEAGKAAEAATAARQKLAAIERSGPPQAKAHLDALREFLPFL